VTRAARLTLLVLGVVGIVWLVSRTGPRLLLELVVRVGWSFLAIVALYAVHVGLRAVALWRSLPAGLVPFAEVLRVRLSGEAVEMLTFTGPFLAEPAKGWLLTRRGMTTTDAFAAVITEYLLYTVTSSWLAATAVIILLGRGRLPSSVHSAAVLVLGLTLAFIAAFAYAAIAGVGLIVPILLRSRWLLGRRRAEAAALTFAPIEDSLIRFLHGRHGRVAQVFVVEAVAQLLLILEIWIVIAVIGLSTSWRTSLIVEGGVKFIGVVFGFVPGQFGASEGVYVLLARAVGLPAAAGLTLALVRRVRGLLVAGAGLVVLSRFDHR